MRKTTRQRGLHKSQAGMTVIELLIAGVVLVIGLLAVVGLFSTAIGNNGRSKIDSTATMLTQAVIEQITAVLARGGPPTITDCGAHDAANPWAINVQPGGSRLGNAGIDFSETAPPDGYHMDYAVCNGPNLTTYDVRWNVQILNGDDCQPGSSGTCLVTVSARPKAFMTARFSFSLPVHMRAYVGPQ